MRARLCGVMLVGTWMRQACGAMLSAGRQAGRQPCPDSDGQQGDTAGTYIRAASQRLRIAEAADPASQPAAAMHGQVCLHDHALACSALPCASTHYIQMGHTAS